MLMRRVKSELPKSGIPQLGQRVRRAGYTLLLSACCSLLMPSQVMAAERLVITYGPLRAGVSVQDLETLVTTDEVPGSLRFYLGLAGLDPNLLRSVLSMKLGASSDFMTGMLDSDSGQQLLTQMSEVIHLPPARSEIQILKTAAPNREQPSEPDNVEALRTALIKAADDRQVTVLEVLQHYPSERVYVDAVKLIRFANSLEAQPTEAVE
nr:MAG: alpha/beta hydrolase [Leptolyngbya sp. IPPAS B-1204]